MASNTRVGVVGTGHWGKNLLRNFHELGVLAAFAEPNDERRNEFAKLYPNASAFGYIEELLSSETVDAVAIATPPTTHGEIACKVIDSGKHVFVEKPLCLDLDEARMVAKRAKNADVRLMVGHLLLYHPAFIKLKEVIEKGDLGAIRYIYSNRAALGKIRTDENALWSFAPHDISMILSLLGHLPSEVVTSGGSYVTQGVADTTLTHMSFDNGVRAHIFVSWLHPYKDQRLVVVGDKAMIEFNDLAPIPEKLQIFKHSIEVTGELPTVQKAPSENIELDWVEPLRNECMHFLDCIETGCAPRSNGAEGIRVLQVLDASHRALESGKSILLS